MIDTNAGAVANFNAIKAQIRQQATTGEQVKAEGESYQVVDSFQVSSPDGNYTVRKGSSFDNDPKTKDTVSVALINAEGAQENRKFEHYSAKKLWLFNEERLTVSTQISSQGNGGFFSSNSSRDFAI